MNSSSVGWLASRTSQRL